MSGTPPRCVCCKVFGHVLEECPKNDDAGAIKNLKKTSQTPKGILSTKEVSKSNPFEVLTSIDDDVDLGTPLVPTGIMDSDSEVEVVFDETANLRISTSGKEGSDKGYGTNKLFHTSVKKSAMDSSFTLGSTEEADNVKILQS
ncbi:hypothetical protein Tco_0494463 [Tanacetum coccineum]